MEKDTNFYAKKKGYVYRKTTLGMTSLSIVFPMGSGYETIGRRGISHLMEHLITKPLDKFNTFFTSNCIEFNAYTSVNNVVVHFKGMEEYLNPEVKQKMIDTVLHGFGEVTEEQFETEKQIVLQELADVQMDPFYSNLINILYGRYRVLPPTGFKRDIINFTFKEAKEMAKDVFTKPIRIVDIANRKTEYKNVEYRENCPYSKKLSYHPMDREIYTVQKCDNSFVFSVYKKPVNKLDYIFAHMGLEMLFSGLESPFFQEIREKRGLCYDISYSLDYITHNSVLSIGMSVEKKNVKTLVSVLNDMFKNIKTYLTRERFESIKKQYTIYNKIIKILRYSKNNSLVEAEIPCFYLRLDDITYEKVCEIIEMIFNDMEIIVK